MFALAEIPKQPPGEVRYNLPAEKLAVEAIAPIEKYKKPTDAETEEALQRWLIFARKCAVKSNQKTVRFNPYEFQEDLFRSYWQHGLLVVGKPRQHGLTETISNILLWQASENPAFSALIISKGQNDTKKVSRRVQAMARSHGSIETDRANDEEVSVDGGGILYFLNAKPSAGRSYESVLRFSWTQLRSLIKLMTFGRCTGSQSIARRCSKAGHRFYHPPPPEEDESKLISICKKLITNNGDRDVVKIANAIREGAIRAGTSMD